MLQTDSERSEMMMPSHISSVIPPTTGALCHKSMQLVFCNDMKSTINEKLLN